jgi:predicted nucleic acid-binding protein
MNNLKVLLDTNIIIHREATTVNNKDIGVLFKWIDKAKYIKCIHPITIDEIKKNSNEKIVETFLVKLQSYNQIKNIAPIDDKVKRLAEHIDANENDINDTHFINEIYCNRVDYLISEDKKIHRKAQILGISDRVFTIDSFLEKIVAEFPELVDYKVLSVTKKHFGEINLQDKFFDSFKIDYPEFDKWFNRKADEIAYVTLNKGNLLSFLYLKIEEKDENYSSIDPVFKPKKRLKIGTFKVISNGVKLGERFMKIVFDNALANKVDEIYVTIYNKRTDQQRLIDLLEAWGFYLHGTKETELVYVRDFTPKFNDKDPKKTYPYISRKKNVYLNPIYPDYHTELLPDSILTNESPLNFVENGPHRNALSKVYISRSWFKALEKGDIIIFYRTGGFYKSVITTIGLVENVELNISNEDEFISKCRKRSIFTDDQLRVYWNKMPTYRPFIVNFMYIYTFPIKINMAKLIELEIIKDVDSAPRGFTQLSHKQFETILKETNTDESFIVD